jgi:sigma-B regulation protein RsbU (phosphoserine phosphatase)
VLDDVLADWHPGQPSPAAACYCTAHVHGTEVHLQLSLAGHPPALLRHPDGTLEELGEPATMLGCGLPRTAIDSNAVLAPGAMLIICTDGVVEARSRTTGEFFDDERLHALLRRLPPDLDAKQIVTAVVNEVERFTDGPLHDDVAVLVLRNPRQPLPG